MPVFRRVTAKGDTLGATTPGNALLPGITPFADAGSRIRGVGYLRNAAIRECANPAPGCLASRLRLWPFDVDLEACVDPAAGLLTRRFIFTNRAATSRPLAYVDVITPRVNGDDDGATTEAPAGGGTSATLDLYDSFQPTRYIRHWGDGSAGVAYSADIDTATQLTARIAADAPLGGGKSAGPAAVGLALGFDFGMVSPSAAETVTVFTVVQVGAPTGIADDSPAARGHRLDASPVPFRSELALSLTLPGAEAATVDVYDVQGRLVRRLLDGRLPAGPHRLVWDGQTGGGTRAAAGIYFIRYAGAGAVEVRRVVRLR
jgi:FlgD Ig-like domain